MFVTTKNNFEQSLRTRLFPVMPAQNGHNPGLNPEFHRGCTGKAHACGTVKSRLNRLNNNTSNNHKANSETTENKHATQVTNGNKKLVQRKNSISSETISDSGSENSAPSWLDATDCVVNNNKNNNKHNNNSHVNDVDNLSNGGKTPEANRKRLIQLRKHNLAKNMPAIVASSSGSKLLHARSYMPRNLIQQQPRRRLHSEGDRASETGASTTSTSSIANVVAQKSIQKQQKQQQQQQSSTFERIQKYRSFRVGSTSNNNNTNKNSITRRPPWNSGSSSSSSPVLTMTTTFNSRNYRNSFRGRNTTDWPTIWERSFALRGYGINSGLYKNYNELIKQKKVDQNHEKTLKLCI